MPTESLPRVYSSGSCKTTCLGHKVRSNEQLSDVVGDSSSQAVKTLLWEISALKKTNVGGICTTLVVCVELHDGCKITVHVSSKEA